MTFFAVKMNYQTNVCISPGKSSSLHISQNWNLFPIGRSFYLGTCICVARVYVYMCGSFTVAAPGRTKLSVFFWGAQSIHKSCAQKLCRAQRSIGVNSNPPLECTCNMLNLVLIIIVVTLIDATNKIIRIFG